jgi:23S rRNA pseudouridine1911/1915/1917 synthase
MRVVRWTTTHSGRLDSLIAAEMDSLSRSRAAQLIRDGHVSVSGNAAKKPGQAISAGWEIAVELPAPVAVEAIAQDLPVACVYQDKDLVVVNKAAGMVVHPGAGHIDGTLVNALLFHITDLSGIGGALRPGIVHRLDRGTSGLMVVAKNDRAHRSLAGQFADKTAGRKYLALCHGGPKADSGTIQSELARHPVHRKRWASTDRGGKLATTHWRVLGRKGALFVAECVLETGRTHQIRVHMTESGWPLVGDTMYTRRNVKIPASIRACIDPAAQRPMLHAWSLSLKHPETGEALCFTAKPPDDMSSCLGALDLLDVLPAPIR